MTIWRVYTHLPAALPQSKMVTEYIDGKIAYRHMDIPQPPEGFKAIGVSVYSERSKIEMANLVMKSLAAWLTKNLGYEPELATYGEMVIVFIRDDEDSGVVFVQMCGREVNPWSGDFDFTDG